MNIDAGHTLCRGCSIGYQVLTEVLGKNSGNQWPRKPKDNPEHAVSALYLAMPQIPDVMEAPAIRPPESKASVNAERNSTRATGRGLRDWQPVQEE